MQVARPASEFRGPSRVPPILLGFLRLVWHVVRVPPLIFLAILEPFVSIVLMGLATLGVLMCFFYRFLVHDPHFPFWLMMGISLGFALLLLPYYALMRLLGAR